MTSIHLQNYLHQPFYTVSAVSNMRFRKITGHERRDINAVSPSVQINHVYASKLEDAACNTLKREAIPTPIYQRSADKQIGIKYALNLAIMKTQMERNIYPCSNFEI